MSHIRSNLNPGDRLYQSIGEPAMTATASAASDPRGTGMATNVSSPAARSTWPDAFRTILAVLRTWHARQRARRELAAIDAHTLRDIGIAPELVDYELSQPFWRPLRDWRD